MMQSDLLDKKWAKFLKRTWLFGYIPFVDFVLAAGSMALGNVRPESDFDVIVGCRHGRIFTTRFFCWLIFGFLGWRRKKWHGHSSTADKVCFNHFVTEKSCRLSPPHNLYWKNLYLNLVPIFGSDDSVSRFFQANADWLGQERRYSGDPRHLHKTPSPFKKIVEVFLNGQMGNLLERILKRIQIRKIEKGLKTEPSGYKPRIVYNDAELEFHPDTKRIEDFL